MAEIPHRLSIYQETRFGGFPGGPEIGTLLPVQGTQVRSLVRELRFHKPHSVAKKKGQDEIL